jgi:hypothetical protein
VPCECEEHFVEFSKYDTRLEEERNRKRSMAHQNYLVPRDTKHALIELKVGFSR